MHAIFLVSAEDKAAHDVFRQFRSSFETRGARFDHLVIFGQHGVSSTVKGLLPGFGLHTGSIPALVLFPERSAATGYVLPLPRGREGDDSRWLDLLVRVEEVADNGEDLDSASFAGLSAHQLDKGSLIALVHGLLRSST